MSQKPFIQYFPVIAPPITITDESALEFSRANKPFPNDYIVDNFGQWELDWVESDEIEYLPCCQFNVSEEFHTLVYWRARPLQYEYFLITIDKKGELIDRRLIACLISQENNIVRMAASIDENHIIYLSGGLEGTEETNTQSIEILPDGKFIYS